MPRSLALGGIFLPLMLVACNERARSVDLRPADARVWFTDVTDTSGIDFHHQNGAKGRRYLPETMGGGAAWFDLDNDGDLDLFLVQSGMLYDAEGAPPPRNALYRNDGERFVDVSEKSGAALSTGYGQGVTAGDFDGDGRVDLYVTSYGSDVLLRNLGDGSFGDVTAASGIDNPEWASSATFFDMEGDGDLDLYVVNYVRFSMDELIRDKGAKENRAYPHPDRYLAAPDHLYRNDGTGRFEEVSHEVGIVDVDGKGLGVAAVDIDLDGDLDLYVANDSTPNHLFENVGEGRFKDVSVTSNAGYNADGATEAGMGIAIGDIDGDLLPDVFVTNLDLETNTLYHNRSNIFFTDETVERGLAVASRTLVGFGTAFFDVDLDGDLDLLVGNGHILDNVEVAMPGSQSSYRQPALLFENDGTGRFQALGELTPPALREPRVVRAVALADYDNDGDVDVAFVQNNAPAVLLRNDSTRSGNYLIIDVVDERGFSVRDAVARYRSAGKERVALSLASGSYCASSDPRITIGTPAMTLERLEIIWPTGEKLDLTDVAMNRIVRIGPAGLVERD